MSPIATGDMIPDGMLAYFDENDQLQSVSVHTLCTGKKVILVAVVPVPSPLLAALKYHIIAVASQGLNSKFSYHVDGSMKHVPGFIEKAEELKAKGVDEILCISVNDPFVMKAWAKTYPENKHVKFLADGSALYTHALGLELDLSEKGLGIRSRRFALLIDDLKVKVANVESGGEFTVSSADEILKAL
ncbi:thioredoxin-dependent peroxidase 1 [Actinidia rufa]|uniref:Glutaredoxin-dependent peroxiredoxin n=1 Tax=Actinidia rufa TaxID=165716 RepID=A0A7J0FEF8_9ERIC|nr:thioredoxin-dependent peroxidase 1 [Actinidia rufa]